MKTAAEALTATMNVRHSISSSIINLIAEMISVAIAAGKFEICLDALPKDMLDESVINYLKVLGYCYKSHYSAAADETYSLLSWS